MPTGLIVDLQLLEHLRCVVDGELRFFLLRLDKVAVGTSKATSRR
jgi:hypothetical protein